MLTNVLERIRTFEADIECCIDSIVQQDLFAESITNARHRILLDHFIVQQASLVRTTAEKLLDAYLEEEEIVEIQALPANTPEDVTNAVKAFEAKIADIREYHHTYRDLPPVRNVLHQPNPKLLEDVFSIKERYGACFDIDAHYGRYSAFMVYTKALAEKCEESSSSSNGADAKSSPLHETLKELSPLTPSLVRRWSPMWLGRLDFFRFTKALPHILRHEVEAHRKVVGFRLYQSFIAELWAYLENFYRRVHPLKLDALERLVAEVDVEAEEYWAALMAAKAEVVSVVTPKTSKDEDLHGAEEGWVVVSRAEGDAHPTAGPAACLAVENKVACGLVIPPSLRRHTKRFSLWPIAMIEKVLGDSTRGEKSADGDAKALSNFPQSLAEVKVVCVMETKAASLLQSLLFTVLETTDKTLLRDYSRTMEELEDDRERAEEEFLSSLDEVRKNSGNTMEGTVAHAAEYNFKLALEDEAEGQRTGRSGQKTAPFLLASSAMPSKPHAKTAAAAVAEEEDGEEEQFIGENGEPIPRWLAQLHQLDKMFRCDVCGGTVYKGPKVFREHFGAERHAEGLRRLGVIQHLKSYEGITSIRQVVEMRDRLSGNENGFRKRLRDNTENEELQDARGHVVTAREYLRLQQRRR